MIQLVETAIPGLLIIEPRVFRDARGYFFESYTKAKFSAAGIEADFVQDNESRSTYGVCRGLHYQLEPYAQSKLVRVIEGEVIDVAVDIRKGSPTYGKYVKVLLSGENKRQFFIPRGFAHGFIVKSREAIFAYKCDNEYAPGHEGGIIFNDPSLAIDWEVDHKDILVSEKDLKLPGLGNELNNFTYFS